MKMKEKISFKVYEINSIKIMLMKGERKAILPN